MYPIAERTYSVLGFGTMYPIAWRTLCPHRYPVAEWNNCGILFRTPSKHLNFSLKGVDLLDVERAPRRLTARENAVRRQQPRLLQLLAVEDPSVLLTRDRWLSAAARGARREGPPEQRKAGKRVKAAVSWARVWRCDQRSHLGEQIRPWPEVIRLQSPQVRTLVFNCKRARLIQTWKGFTLNVRELHCRLQHFNGSISLHYCHCHSF